MTDEIKRLLDYADAHPEKSHREIAHILGITPGKAAYNIKKYRPGRKCTGELNGVRSRQTKAIKRYLKQHPGATPAELAGALNLPRESVNHSLANMQERADMVVRRIKKQKSESAKKRECLRCGKSFVSEWIGNRICNKCKKSHDDEPYLPSCRIPTIWTVGSESEW